MPPYLRFLVSIGQWVQAHHEVVFASTIAVVFLVSILPRLLRASMHDRRPW
jgi:hypothetical protein